MVVVKVGDPFRQVLAVTALLHAEDEQVNVGIQRELVHGVNQAHVVENEEENGGSLGTRTIGLQGDRML